MQNSDESAVRFRPMTGADAHKVAELARELGYANEAQAIRERMQTIGPSALLLVAVDAADEPVGLVQANRTCIIEVGDRVEIVGLVVSTEARRSGIGRKLLAEVERWAANIGVKAVVVRSNTARTESHIFYPAMGYKAIKTQAVYEKQLEPRGRE
jgi:GNAT superfamily N-acetyltransferase